MSLTRASANWLRGGTSVFGRLRGCVGVDMHLFVRIAVPGALQKLGLGHPWFVELSPVRQNI